MLRKLIDRSGKLGPTERPSIALMVAICGQDCTATRAMSSIDLWTAGSHCVVTNEVEERGALGLFRWALLAKRASSTPRAGRGSHSEGLREVLT